MPTKYSLYAPPCANGSHLIPTTTLPSTRSSFSDERAEAPKAALVKITQDGWSQTHY
jgi:hypothetical protein